MLSTQALISFVAQGNVQTVSKYLKFNPSSPVRGSYFASQPCISFFPSRCAPLCLAKPPLWPWVTVLWVIVSALGCLSNVRDSEGQSEASNLPHRLSPSKGRRCSVPIVNLLLIVSTVAGKFGTFQVKPGHPNFRCISISFYPSDSGSWCVLRRARLFQIRDNRVIAHTQRRK